MRVPLALIFTSVKHRCAAAMDLVRLAILRRTYTQSHMDYVIEVMGRVMKRAKSLKGFKIVEQPPALRHFSARFAPL